MKYVISLGGSIIVPDRIDMSFIKKFAKLISSYALKGHLFFIVTGGGATARNYQTVAKKLNQEAKEPILDWIGISATKLNAQLLEAVLGREVLRKVKVFSGWKPGRSTDYVAVKIAAAHGVKAVINLSNIDYVYDIDPKKVAGAKKISRLTWREFRRKFGSKWTPGANVPFDPVAASFAQKQGIGVIIANGRNLSNLKNLFSGESFAGTTIGS